jgi:ribulose-phosphate 3-epimerase
MRIWPSLLAADCLNLQKEIQILIDAGISQLHLDIMDNHYVPNLSFGPVFCEAIHRRFPNLEIDVHLMTDNPQSLIKRFAEAGANRISIHIDSCIHLHDTLMRIKAEGLKAGIAINPAEEIPELDWCDNLVDYLLMMSVNPGFGGQKFIESSFRKIAAIQARHPQIPIMVDGGVDLSNLNRLKQLAVSDVVIGSALFNASNFPLSIQQFKDITD